MQKKRGKKDKSRYDFYGDFYRYVDDSDGKQELESLGKNTGLMDIKEVTTVAMSSLSPHRVLTRNRFYMRKGSPRQISYLISYLPDKLVTGLSSPWSREE